MTEMCIALCNTKNYSRYVPVFVNRESFPAVQKRRPVAATVLAIDQFERF